MRQLFLAGLLMIVAGAGYAHSKMDKTTPSDGAILSAPPAELAFAFSDKLRLVKVELVHSGGGTQALDLEEHTSFGNAYSLPIEPMGPGTYEVEWRGLGIDGHAMKGSFTFEVQ